MEGVKAHSLPMNWAWVKSASTRRANQRGSVVVEALEDPQFIRP